MPTLKQCFEFAQLAQASYASLERGLQSTALINANTAGFSFAQVAAFVDDVGGYTLLSHQPNDPSGFSASVFKDNATGQITVAFRGTEGSPGNIDLGDIAADADILVAGYARQQIISAYNYYQRLIGPAGQPVSQLVEQITDQPPDDGRPFTTFPGTTQFLSYRAELSEVGMGVLSPTDHVIATGHSSGGHLAAAFSRLFPTIVDQIYTYNAPGFGTNFTNAFFSLIPGASGAFEGGKITNVTNATGPEIVPSIGANGGSQVLVYGETGTHSSSALTDTLALYGLFATLNDQLDVQTVTDILYSVARTNSMTLEAGLDALRKLFNGGQQSETPVGDREQYYSNLVALKGSLSPNGQSLGLSVLSLKDLSAPTLINLAHSDIAFRYALKELNPFVVIGANYALHNDSGQLALVNPETSVGELTTNYLAERAQFLVQKIALNVADDTGVSAPENRTAFRDLASGYQIVPYQLQASKVFGSSEADTVTGTDFSDHLYGGGGDDIIMGGKGIDYIEGGAGVDIIQGGEANDTIEGGNGNDFITGGRGDDLLRGGIGYDQYFYASGDGNDQIEDSDGQGVIIVDHGLLLGGIRQAGATDWVSPDGQVHYQLSGANLTIRVNGSELTVIGGSTDGQFGIALDDAASYSNELPTRTEFTKEVPDPDNPGQTITVPVFDDGSNGYTITEAENDIVHALGGDDTVFAAGGGNDQLYGEEGNDILGAGLGNDQLYGGIGSDQLQGDDGDDTLSGDEDNDILLGGSGEDVLLGGAGDDVIKADGPDNLTLSWDPANDGSDWLDGGSGNDNLAGGGSDDVLSGDTGDDSLFGDYSNVFLSRGGDDTLDGGDGNDGLVGGAGADILFGGEGNDLLYGDLNADDQGALPTVGGDDVLYGDEGNDVLYGGIGDDALFGGAGNDRLDGGNGNDELYGGDGNDALYGGTGDDVLDGGAGDDLMDGGDGNNILSGGGGNDEFVGHEGNDTFMGGDGNDKLTGAAGNDALSGGAGDDMLLGDDRVTVNSIGVSEFTAGMSAGMDALTAGEGDDKVYGSGGDDLLLGGAGNDLLVGDDFIFNAPQVGFDGNFVEAFRYSHLSGNDQIDAGAGDDEVYGGAGDDAITGGMGDDVLYGDRRALFGGDYDDIQLGGNDIMDGGEGNDYLDAGVGNDVLSGGDGADSLFGGDGNDSLDGGAGNDLLQGDGGGFGGGLGDDLLFGGEGSNHLLAGDGNDLLDGGAGNDILDGGYSGSDNYVFGRGYGRDEVRDSGFGFGEVDVIQMNSDVSPDDFTVMRSGDHLTFRIQGVNDQLTVQNFFLDPSYQIEQVQFMDGTVWDPEAIKDRLLTGSEEKRRLEGFSDRDDLIQGSGADDVLLGLAGNDTLSGGSGQDRLYGGSGSDTYLFGRGSGLDTVFDAAGSGGGSGGPPPSFAFEAEGPGMFASSSTDLDTIRMDDDIAPGDVTVFRNGHHLLLRLNEAIPAEGSPADAPPGPTDQLTLSFFFADPALQAKQVEFADGTLWDAVALQTQAQPLGSTEQPDVLHGTAGDDLLMGLGGNDLLDGRSGADRLIGGAGDDTYVVDQAGDVSQEEAGEGTDTVRSSISYTLGDNVEKLLLTGVAAIDGTGNALDNILAGNTGANVLTGGLGNDTYFVSSGDTVVEAIDEGTDTIVAASSYALNANVENLTLTGTAASDGMGNELNNVLAGNDGVNLLDGGAGADILIGGKGDDTYVVDADDSVVESVGGGIDTVLSAQTYVLGANIENLLLTGTAAADGTGNGLDNVLTGNEAANVLIGGMGNDTYVAGSDDTVLESADEGIDTIVSAGSYTLGANLENLTLGGDQATDATGNELGNVLAGNRGNNILTGGAGNDTYLFGRGSGQDVALDNDATAENFDAIRIADDVNPGDVTVTRAVNDLILSLRGASDQLTVQNFFLDSVYQVEAVTFGDGTVWDTVAIMDRLPVTLTGTNGEDALYGGGGADILNGGAGNDALYGYDGDDTYVFGGGSGHDQMLDFDAAAGNIDTIQMTADVTPDEVAVTRTGDDLALNISGAFDQLTVQSFFLDPAYRVERISFADGTAWDAETLVDKTRLLQQGGFGNDFLRGASPGGHGADDLLDGGMGDDTLLGDNLSGAGFGGEDKLLGGEGSDLLFGRGGDDVLDGGDGHDLLQGDGGFTDGFSGLPVGDADVSGSDLLLGGDGNDSLYGAGGDDHLDGGSGDDSLSGDGGFGFTSFVGTALPGNDALIGGEGHDELNGGAGDDVLDGGSGNDILIGGAGNDVFVFGRGYGQDFIEGFGSDGDFSPTSVNTIRFAADVAASDVLVVRSGDWNRNDLTFQIHGTSDQLTVREFFGGGYTPIQQAQFGDGTLWDLDRLRHLSSSIVGTSYSDSLTGVDLDETLTGLDGDDVLDGGIGADTLVGGSGDDTYVVDNEWDQIVEVGDEGVDSVQSSVNYALAEHVENLTLQDGFNEFGSVDPGRSAIFGIGNDGDNLIVGNSAGNVLDGGAGDDVLAGGADGSGGGGGAGFAAMADFSGEGSSSLATGDDILIGGGGNDTFFFNFGDGIDTIVDSAVSGQGNRIQFGEGIVHEDLTFEHDAIMRTLTIHVGFEGDMVRLASFDPNQVNGTLVVETLELSDGSEVSMADLFPPTGSVVTEGNDVLVLGPDDDVIDALGGNDVVDGDGGNDHLVGGSGDDQLIGGAGNDVLDGGEGADTLSGGDGDDTLYVDAADTSVEGGSGFDDVIVMGDTGVTLDLGLAQIEAVQGGVGDDLFTTTGIDGVIMAGNEGDDQLTGAAGCDGLDGGAGNDQLGGGNGDDTLTGGDGDDVLDGDAGADRLEGGEGNDRLYVDVDDTDVNGGTGTDTVYVTGAAGITLDLGLAQVEVAQGGTGSDVFMTSGTDAITVAGSDGDDYLTGGAGDDVLEGGSGKDVLAGGEGADSLSGGAGDDVLYIDAQDQSIDGGAGTDIVFVQGSDGVTLDLGQAQVEEAHGSDGDDIFITSGGGTFTAFGESGNDSLIGGAGDEHLYGGADDDLLMGGAGSDQLAGDTGNDVLDGGIGEDALLGGAGDDIYVVDDPGDLVTEAANEGVDTVQSSITYGLGAHVERLTMTGDQDLNGKGNELDNLLTGNSGANVLDGGAGTDLLVGGAGDDTYRVDHVGDLVVEAANEGMETVLSSVSYALGSNVENLTLIGSGVTDGTGNELDNVLTGNIAANTLDAGEGSDTLIGGAGNDTLHGGMGDDLFRYHLGDGLDRVMDTAGLDAVYFGAGISFDNTVVRLTQEAGETIAHLRLLDVSGDELAGQGMDLTLGPDCASPIEQFVFADGTTSILSDLVIQTMVTEGTRHGDVIRAGRHDDIIYAGKGGDAIYAATGNDTAYAGKGGDQIYGEGGNDTLHGEQGKDYLDGGSGNDLLEGGNGDDRLLGGDGQDRLFGGTGKDSLSGGAGADYLNGGKGEDCLSGGAGNDSLDSGRGDDTILFGRGDGEDTLVGLEHNHDDTVRFGTNINPLDLILSRQVDDLKVSIHGTTDAFTVRNWYGDRHNETEAFVAGNGQSLANTAVDQLIQAMAVYSNHTGLTWAQAVDQRPTDVAEILAASWQSS